MIKILDRYIFFEWLKIFAIAVFVTLGILIMHDMYSNLGDLINYGASAYEIVYYYLLLTPRFIPVILPISLLLSLIFVLGALHRNNEITAMRAAGLNVFSITKSLWISGVVLSLGLFWITAHLVPTSVEKSRLMMDTLHIQSEMKKSAGDLSNIGKIQQMCFANRKDRRLWIMNSFSMATNKATGVFVSCFDENGAEASKIMAREAVYDDVDGCWFFSDGQEISYDVSTSRAVRSVVFDKKYYRDFREDPEIMRLSMKRVKDLSLFEINELLEASAKEGLVSAAAKSAALKYEVRLYNIWLSPLICIIVVAIAIPFSVAGVRTNPMVGVSKTVAMFFAYYMIDNIFSALGGAGYISPVVAAFAPAAIMLIFALSLYRKVI